MIGHIEINGRHFYNVTPEDLAAAGIDASVIDAALKAEKWEGITQKRTQLLFETDWTQGKDTPLSSEKIAEFAAYRQELRNIPQAYSNPFMVIWPIKPIL